MKRKVTNLDVLRFLRYGSWQKQGVLMSNYELNDYISRLNRLQTSLQQEEPRWRFARYHQIYLAITVQQPRSSFRVRLSIVEGVIVCHCDIVNLPKKKPETHKHRCLKMMNLMAQIPGYGRFALIEPVEGGKGYLVDAGA